MMSGNIPNSQPQGSYLPLGVQPQGSQLPPGGQPQGKYLPLGQYMLQGQYQQPQIQFIPQG